MVILHYTLGFAPYRSGGLVKYATDLILEQQKNQIVYLLYPAGYRWWNKRIYWEKTDNIQNNIQTIKLKNSYPIPLLYGIKNPRDFISGRKMSNQQMENLYKEIHPDVFHVHTLMGLPKELLLFFKEKGVKLVYTSHDYFGICPKVNLMNNEGMLCDPSLGKCISCNKTAVHTLFLRIRNSNIVLSIKNNRLIHKLLKK